MNVIAIMNHMGVYFKEEPIRELHRALERLDFRIVYPNDRDDLLKLIENNSRLCGVIFDWDKYNLELCEEISKMKRSNPDHNGNTHPLEKPKFADLEVKECAANATTPVTVKAQN